MSYTSSMMDTDSFRCRSSNASTCGDQRINDGIVMKVDSIKDATIPSEVVLKRHMGLISGVCYIICMIIGSGIFVSPKGVLRGTESVGLCLIVWIVAGLLSLVGALCYAEIGTLIPRNGAEIAYFREGIGSVHERTGEVLAYLYNWANILILKPSSIAILTLTFSQYFLSGIFTDCKPPEELVKLTTIFTMLVLMNINALSVSAANRLTIIFVFCKLITVITVIIIGFIRIIQGHTINLQNGFEGTITKPLAVAGAFYSGLWAYDGWNGLNSITEELKNPKRNLWLSIALALPSVIILYLLTNISYFTVMSKAELLASNAVAVSWGEVTLGPVVRALPILISISALGSANASLFGFARYCMVGAQYGYLPELLACIHKKRLTPVPGIFFGGILTIISCLPSNIEQLIDFFSFSSWIFYGLSFLATLCCKFTMKNAQRVISIPIPLIVIIILMSIYLVVAPIIADPNIGYLIATVTILFGLVFYYPFVYRKIQIKAVQKNQSIFNGVFWITSGTSENLITSLVFFCKIHDFMQINIPFTAPCFVDLMIKVE